MVVDEVEIVRNKIVFLLLFPSTVPQREGNSPWQGIRRIGARGSWGWGALPAPDACCSDLSADVGPRSCAMLCMSLQCLLPAASYV